MSDAGRHGRSFVWLLAAEVGQRLLSVVLFIYLNHALSVEENGWYGLFVAVFPVLVVITNLGLSDVITREVAKAPERARSLSSTAWRTQPLVFMPVLALLYAGARVLDLANPVTFILALGAAAALFQAMSRVNFAVFAAREQFQYLSLMLIVVRTGIVVASIAVLELGFDVRAIVALLVPAYAAQWVAGAYLSRRYRRANGADASPRYLVSEGWPMALGGLTATAFIAIDMPLLYAFEDPDTGLYGLGVRFYMMLVMLPEILATLFYPILSRKTVGAVSEQSAALVRCLKATWLMVCPLAAGLSVCGTAVVDALAAEAYLGAVPIVAVLAWVWAIEAVNYTFVMMLRAKGLQRIPMIVYGTTTAVKIAAAVALIPRFGVEALLTINLALALAMTLALVVAAGGALDRQLSVRRLAEALLRPTVAVAAMAAVLWSVRSHGLTAIVPIGLAAYAAGLLLTKALDERDWDVIRGTLSEWRR